MSKKIAFVTGSARGIGQAICQRFMADGLQIIGLDQNPDAANPWPEIHYDLSQTETIEQSFQDVLKSSGAAPDILVNMLVYTMLSIGRRFLLSNIKKH